MAHPDILLAPLTARQMLEVETYAKIRAAPDAQQPKKTEPQRMTENQIKQVMELFS